MDVAFTVSERFGASGRSRHAADGHTLVLSPSGLEYRGDASIRRVTWAGEPTEGFRAVRPVGLGLVGRGSTEVTGSPVAERTYAQDPGRYGTDLASGQPRTAIPLAQFAQDWQSHRIGAWVEHHRPEIAPQAARQLGGASP